MKNLKIFNYEGSNITFKQGDVTMVNATEMAKAFDKSPKHWLVNANTKEFLSSLAKVRNLTLADLVQVTHGGDQRGTWMHEDVAMEFARWLSPAFSIWCNDKIKELLTTGQTSLKSLTRKEMARMVIEAEEEKERLELQLQEQTKVITQSKPKVEFYDKVLSTENGIPISVIASELGCSAMHLNKILNKIGVQYKIAGTWMLYANHKGKGYTITKTYTYQNSQNETISRVTMMWTQKGREFIHNTLKLQGIEFKKVNKGLLN